MYLEHKTKKYIEILLVSGGQDNIYTIYRMFQKNLLEPQPWNYFKSYFTNTIALHYK